jgi:hypothetical protein
MRIFAVAVVAATWIAIATGPFNSAGALTITGKRCEERRETLTCRRSESLDNSSEASDDDECGCGGGGASGGSGAVTGTAQSSSPLSGSSASGGSPGHGSGGGGGAPGQGSNGGEGMADPGLGAGAMSLAKFEQGPSAEQRWSEINNGLAPTVPVPAPIVGAGLPALMVACGGLLALARRRRRIP